MKKVLTILLCCLLPLTLLFGCGKQRPQLTEQQIAADLTRNSGYYNLAYTDGNYAITDLTVLEKIDNDNAMTVTIRAVASNLCVRTELTADMGYLLQENGWNMNSVTIKERTSTVVGAPNQKGVVDMLYNYIDTVGRALAIQGEERHELPLNLKNATWEMKHDDKATTARLHISIKNAEMNLSGYYELTFSQTGWSVKSEKQEDNRLFPILYIEEYENLKKK